MLLCMSFEMTVFLLANNILNQLYNIFVLKYRNQCNKFSLLIYLSDDFIHKNVLYGNCRIYTAITCSWKDGHKITEPWYGKTSNMQLRVYACKIFLQEGISC